MVIAMANRQNVGSHYRWYILTLATLTFTFVVAIPTMCMPVLFKEISQDLHLSLVQIGTIWGIAFLAGACVVLAGGILSDRFGAKSVLSVVCFLAGLAGAMRGLSGSFATLAITMFLFGLLTAIIPTTIHKTCGVWFLGRYLGLANAVVSMGMALGYATGAIISATILSPLLGSWRNVLFLYGAISMIISSLWLLTRGTSSQSASQANYAHSVPFRQALAWVVRIKGVWLLGFIMLGQTGSVQGMLGYLPLYLREMGWPPATADSAVATFHWASMMTAIPIALLSDKIGSRKALLFATTLMTAIGVGLLSVASGPWVWLAVILAGIVRDGFMAILITMVTETEGVGATYAGTAMGLVFTLSRLSSFASPPIGNSLATINLSFPFALWAGLACIALCGFYFVTESGRKPTE
jgi:cyanate permease